MDNSNKDEHRVLWENRTEQRIAGKSFYEWQEWMEEEVWEAFACAHVSPACFKFTCRMAHRHRLHCHRWRELGPGHGGVWTGTIHNAGT